MPALHFYGREWYTTSDMLPFPATIIGTIYLAYTIIFGISIARVDVWKRCTGTGYHYQVVTAGFIAVFALSFLLQLGIFIGGLRGTVFETGKRKFAVFLLYIQSFTWFFQFGLLVYGTYVLYRNKIHPTCGESKTHHNQLRSLTHAMVWGTWGQAIFIMVVLVLLFNSYQGQDKIVAWEKRLQFLASCLCCTDTVKAKDARGSDRPLVSIASWIAGLFSGVELSPSDLMTAIFLTAAAQNMRRRMRIRKALKNPSWPHLPTTVEEDTNADDEETSHLDDLPETLHTMDTSNRSNVDSDSSFRSSVMPGSTPTSQKTPLTGSHPSQKDVGHATKGSPQGYENERQTRRHSRSNSATEDDEDMSSVCEEEGNSRTSWEMIGTDLPNDSQEGGTRTGSAEAGKEDTPFRSGFLASSAGLRSSEFAEGTEDRLTLSDTDRYLSPGSTQERLSRDAPSFRSRGGQSSARRRPGDDSATSSHRSSGEHDDGRPYVRLSQVSQQELDNYAKSQRKAPDAQPSPQERFGIPFKRKRSSDKTPSEPDKEPHLKQSPNATNNKNAIAHHLKASPGVDSPKVTGNKPKDTRQASLESGLLSVGMQSSTLGRGLNFTASMEVLPGEIGGLQDEIVTDMGRRSEQVVPLEKDKSNQVPPIITPSEEVVDIPGSSGHLDGLLQKAHGVQRTVEYSTLEEASNWARFATAVYAVMPFTEESRVTRSTRRCCGIRSGITEEGVRDSVVEIAGIDDDDLLYFSHSNVALSHLPYMIALDRERKAVVVAIRGTFSLADLVTDAVVQPSHLSEWMPAGTRKAKQKTAGGKKKAYGHSGILSAAEAVLEDLKANGILQTLLEPEGVRNRSLEIQRTRRMTEDNLSKKQKQSLLKKPASKRSPSRLTRRKEALDNALPIEGEFSSDAENNLSDAEKGKAGPHQEQCGDLRRNTEGSQAGGVWPSKAFPKRHNNADAAAASGQDQSKQVEGDRMAQAAQHSQGTPQEQGEEAGDALREHLSTKGWNLILTGHSLGGGAATLLSMRLMDRYPDLKCWAFSPPGGLVSRSLLRWSDSWCTSVAVGKDAVPRMTVNNMSRLMDEMVTSLARCRKHKLKILLGGWKSEKGAVPQNLFFTYKDIPPDSRAALERYYNRANKREIQRDMFPAGKLLFLRPIKMKAEQDAHDKEPKIKQAWDAIWSTPEELVAEGVLVSKKMLAHHSITSTMIPAIGYAMRHHPQNPKSEGEKSRDKKEEEEVKSEAESVRDEVTGPSNPLADNVL